MENVFQIKYNTKLDRLEMPRETYINKVFKTIKKHKIVSLITGMFIVLSTVNFYLIYTFMNILERI